MRYRLSYNFVMLLLAQNILESNSPFHALATTKYSAKVACIDANE